MWDSQSVKGSVHEGNGYDGGKKVNGRRRHVLVDTLGLLLEVVVTAANVSDQKGLRSLLQRARHELPRLHHLWVDQGYRGVDFIKAMLLAFGVVLDVVTSKGGQKGFCLQARRWVVEMSQP
jgi:putative transposase